MSTVFFESWRGRYSDSPRVISEYLTANRPQIRQSWVRSSADTFPPTVHQVRRHSPEYFARLITTDFLITNDIVSRHYLDGPAVKHVQCWHGSPLKAIGFDDNRGGYAGMRAQWRRMRRDLRTWDYLISPSPLITPILRSAFAFDGRILEVGSPRNDVLFRDASGSIRAELRRQLGVPPDSLAVLYAPTWRDDDVDAEGRFAQSVVPEWELLAKALPSVKFLFRAHKNVVASAPKLPNIIDANQVPDIAELYLAADVLISDYSSAIFDFAVTGKPIVAYVPDLEHYRNDLRKLYFNYEDWVPGAITKTTAELVDVLEDPAAMSSIHAERYQQFVQDFCPYDDGRVSERLVRALEI